MARRPSLLARRTWWTAGAGLVALAFWVVAFGVGWRSWILTGSRPGIVAHTAEAGLAAAPWMTVAAILTLMTAMMGIGIALVRHLVDGPVEAEEPLDELPELEPKEPLPELGAAEEPEPVEDPEPSEEPEPSEGATMGDESAIPQGHAAADADADATDPGRA